MDGLKGIAISTGSLPRAPLSEQLRQAQNLGFNAVEIVAAAAEKPLISEAQELKSLLEKFGQRLVGWYPHPLRAQPWALDDTNLETVVRDGHLAHKAGCDLLVFPPLPPRDSCDFHLLARLLREALDQLPGTTRIALENHHPWPLMLPGDYQRLFDLISDDRLGIAFDTGHFVASGMDPVEAFRQLEEKVFHLHLKDQTGTQGRPFGQGDARLDAFMKTLLASEYSGWATIEMELEDDSDLLNVLREAKAFVESHT